MDSKVTIAKVLLVAAGGALGSVLRYLTGMAWAGSKSILQFPWPTFTVNIFGSLLIGIVFGILAKTNTTTDNWRLLLATGFCGGFTTLSAMSNEGFLLLRQNQFLTFFMYIIATVLIGILATASGYFLTK